MAAVSRQAPWRLAIGASVCLVLGGGLPAAAANDETTQALHDQIDRLRAVTASQLQLLAFDLLDELVFSWTEKPIFATDTPVVLASLTVPVGLGTALQAELENHLTSLLIRNPATRIRLVHCPSCTAVIVHSGAEGTVVSRGVDAPESLAKVGGPAGSRHALFVDFEAEGTALVLRARVTAIEPELPLVYARTLSSVGTAGALLRDGEHLKSAAEAREELLDALENRGELSFPVRIAVERFAPSQDFGQMYWDGYGGYGGYAPPIQVSPAPYVWLKAGVQTSFTQARAWSASFSLGFTWLERSHRGWLAEARLARLISGRVRSLTRPDLYLVLGGAAVSVRGRDTTQFRKDMPSVRDLQAELCDGQSRADFTTWKIGLELRVKNRISAGVLLEHIPALNDAPSIGRYLDIDIISFHAVGAEVGFWF